MDGFKRALKVYDPGLASVLLLGDYKLLYSGMEPDGQMIFGFERTGNIDKTVEDYFDNEIMINARDFYDHAQMLIAAAYGARVTG